MFSKPAKSQDTTTSAATAASDFRKGPRVCSLIADGMAIEGDLTGDGELHVDGLIKGDIKIARLTVGESGRIEGSVTAETVDCRGRIDGAVTANEVRIYATAHVSGDITQDDLSVETGAWFQGRVLKIQRQTTVQQALLETLPS